MHLSRSLAYYTAQEPD